MGAGGFFVAFFLSLSVLTTTTLSIHCLLCNIKKWLVVREAGGVEDVATTLRCYTEFGFFGAKLRKKRGLVSCCQSEIDWHRKSKASQALIRCK